MINGAGFSESLVHAPVSTVAPYQYRAGCGMMPSAEWSTFFDDFYSFVIATAITNGPVANTPWGWQGAIIDTGATAALLTTAAVGATGVLNLSDATASEGTSIYGTKGIQLTTGKKFFMEARVRTSDVTDNALQIGLSSLTAVTNPEDIWTTAATDLIAFGILDGQATTRMLCDKSNSGSTAEAGTKSLIADTWHVLGISYDGASTVRGYVDGVLSQTWAQAFATTVPTGVALAPFFGTLNGDGTGAATNYFDYIRFAIQR
jgi:hypothetical protein